MKKCIKCGNIVNSRVPYCPNCGTLLPQEKERKLIASSEIQRLKRTPKGMVIYDKKEYEDAINFYKSHLATGYAPKGKILIEQIEYDHLKETREEFEQNKNRYGTQTSFTIVNGNFSLVSIPNYGVSKRTINRNVNIDFGDYWEKLYDKQDILTRIAIQCVYWLMAASCSILVLTLFAKQNTWDTTIGVILTLAGMIIFFRIAFSIFDYD